MFQSRIATPSVSSEPEGLPPRFRAHAVSNLLLWSIAAFVLLFFLWAALTQLDRSVRGLGRVVPNNRLQVVTNLEGGVIEAILVRGGQKVKAGAPLLRLSPIQSGAELNSGEATVFALTAKIERLQSEISGRTPNFPATNDPSLATQVAVERSLHQARMADLSSLLATGRARVAQASQSLGEARGALAARRAAADSARTQLSMIRPLVDRGIEPRMSLVQAERDAGVAAGEAAQASAAVSRAQAAIAEASASTRRDADEWRARIGEELAVARGEFEARRQALPAAADRVRRTVVRSPLDGEVNRVLVNTIGASAAPGAPLVEIVPSGADLVFEVQLQPRDIAFVHIGQPAKVEITAYDAAVYGSLTGEVIAISPDAIVNERTEESHYVVRVRADGRGLRSASGAILPIGAGMTATVNLKGDKRSVLSYIFTPFTRLRENALRDR